VALRVVSMAELRLAVLLEPERTGESVAEVCRRYGISRNTYYRYRRRYLMEGLEGLDDRSHRPIHSPAQMDPELEARICRLRKDHPRWGARRIRAELARAGVSPPVVSTIHQALRRNHLVALQPPRRKRFDKRFERGISNDLWQIDATQVGLVSRTKAWVIDTIDDHSRLLLAAFAAPAPTGEAAWDCFEEAASRYGLPRQVLSDNGLCFSGRLHGVEVEFERSLKELGVEPITSGPYHPQTLGKLERFHRTLKEWLSDEGPAEDIPHLQELLDAFRHHYNSERPHQALGELTPAERYGGMVLPERDRGRTPRPDPSEWTEPTYPPHAIVRKVNRVGSLGYQRRLIQVGRRWAGARVRIIPVGELLHIYWGETLVRVLAVDPNSYYQPIRPERRERTTATVT
jgi:transposase InsO family protein